MGNSKSGFTRSDDKFFTLASDLPLWRWGRYQRSLQTSLLPNKRGLQWRKKEIYNVPTAGLKTRQPSLPLKKTSFEVSSNYPWTGTSKGGLDGMDAARRWIRAGTGASAGGQGVSPRREQGDSWGQVPAAATDAQLPPTPYERGTGLRVDTAGPPRPLLDLYPRCWILIPA